MADKWEIIYCDCPRGREAKRWRDAGYEAPPALLELCTDCPKCVLDGGTLGEVWTRFEDGRIAGITILGPPSFYKDAKVLEV